MFHLIGKGSSVLIDKFVALSHWMCGGGAMAGRGRVPAVSIELSDLERGELEGLSRRRRTAQGLARRAQIVLAAAEGLENKQIAAQLGSDPATVGK
jgi:DNA-binding NarL/FixJ family response regulator